MIGLMDSHGNWITRLIDMVRIILDFYTDLFTSQNPSPTNLHRVLVHVLQVVISEMNARLLAPFIDDEVKAAIFYIHLTKAPGPDGFSTIFFHNTWDVTSSKVHSLVL